MGNVGWTCLQGGLGLGEARRCNTSGGWEGVEVGPRGVGAPVWRWKSVEHPTSVSQDAQVTTRH